MTRRGCDCMVVEFTTTYAISAYNTRVVSSIHSQARCSRYHIMW